MTKHPIYPKSSQEKKCAWCGTTNKAKINKHLWNMSCNESPSVSEQKEGRSFFDMPQKEKEEIVMKASEESNRMQIELVESVKEGDWEKEFREKFVKSVRSKYDEDLILFGIRPSRDQEEIMDFIRKTISLSLQEERDKIKKDLLAIYDEKYSHVTRDYQKVDQYRDDIFKYLTKEIK